MGRAKCIPEDPYKILLPYQDKWVKDKSQLKIKEKSRQIGISWSTACESVQNTAVSEAKTDQWISSRDDIQARLFLEDCKKFANAFDIVAKDKGLVVIDHKKKLSSYVLAFENGKRIHSMSSNPDAQAGKVGGRVLDEFALHPDPKKLYSIAYPGITWGGQLEIISTHRGSKNFFNELINDIKYNGNPKKFSLHTVTLEQALNQGFLYKLQKKLPENDKRIDMDEQEYFDFIRAACATEEQFLQEYMCQPEDDNSAFITHEMIDNCEYEIGQRYGLTGRESDLYLGVDVGRVKDLTVFWLIEKISGIYFTRLVETLENMRFSNQEKYLYELLELRGLKRCCIDKTGIGIQFAERAQDKYGKYKVEGIHFTSKSKEELAYPVRTAFEDRTVKIPNDKKIRADIREIKKSTTMAGNVRFDAERNDNGHSDRFWSLALAIHAAGPITSEKDSTPHITTSMPYQSNLLLQGYI